MEDFMSRKWQIEKSFFDKEIMGYDPKTKKDIPWPLMKQEIRDYKNWLAKVTDPITKRFYKGYKTTYEYDNNGNMIPGSDKTIEKEAHFTRKQIVRLRTNDGKEWLYTRGLLYGYDSLGSDVTQKFQEGENWDEQEFKHERVIDPKTGAFRNVSMGPTTVIPHYTIPFVLGSEETNQMVDKLMQHAVPNVMLCVKEEGQTVAKQCPNLEMFKTKSFDYIKDMGYLSEKEKTEKLEEFQTMQAGAKKKV